MSKILLNKLTLFATGTCMVLALFSFPAFAATPTPEEQFTQSVLSEIVPLFEKKEFRVAFKKLWKVVQEHPDNAELNFRLGIAAFEIGRYEAAASAFERVLIADPEAQRARLELGRAFFQLKSYVLAREQFETVLATNPPKSVANAIHLYLDAIKERMSQHHFNGRIALGWQYDSNVATAPSSSDISTSIGTFVLSSESLPKVDNAAITQLALSHLYDPGQEGGLVWQDNASFYASRYKHQTKYNLDALTLSSGPAYINRTYRVQLPISLDVIQLGNAPYSRNWGIAPTFGYSGIKNLDLSVTGTIQHRKYVTDRERDSNYYATEFTPRFFLANGTMMLQGSIKRFDENAREKYWSNNGLEGALGLMVQLPDNYVLFLQQSRRLTHYLGQQELYDSKRRDRTNVSLINITKRFQKGFSITFSYTYTRNRSNLDLYDYERKQILTMLTWEF